MPVLFLVRHAESEKNVLHIVSHDPTKPYHLTAKGQEQAKKVGKQLSDVTFTRAFASRYPRAQETAQLIIGKRDVPVSIDARIDEIDNGDLEGEPLEKYYADIKDRAFETPPGGETWSALKARLRSFLDDLKKEEGTILVVSHGHPIAMLRGLIGGWDDQKTEKAIPVTAAALRYEI